MKSLWSLCLVLLLALPALAQDETNEVDTAFATIQATLEKIQSAESEEAFKSGIDAIYEQCGEFLDTHAAAANEEQLDMAIGIWLEVAQMNEVDATEIRARIEKVRAIENLPEAIELTLIRAEALLNPPAVGGDAPAWTAIDVHTKEPLSLSDLSGKLVLTDFWAAWCGPCKILMRERLAPLFEQYGSHEGFTLIGMGVNWDETPEEQATYADENGYGWTKVHDESGMAAAAYGVQGIPFLCLSDGEGKILAVGSGFEVIDQIESILAERLAAAGE